MEVSLPALGELLPFLAGMAVSGLVGGVLAGLFGIGGGAVLVPVLVEAFAILGIAEAVRIHLAVGTSLGIVLPTAIVSCRGHAARKAVDWRHLKQWAIPVLLGVALAGLLAARLSGEALRLVFAAIAFVVGIRSLFGFSSWRLGSDLPGEPWRSLHGAGIGLASALMGIGGGVINNTYMILYGRPVRQAVATSSGLGLLVSVPGIIGYALAGWSESGLPPFSVGYVNLVGVLAIVPLTMIAAPLGVRLAHSLSPRLLEAAFGVFLLAVALRFVLASTM